MFHPESDVPHNMPCDTAIRNFSKMHMSDIEKDSEYQPLLFPANGHDEIQLSISLKHCRHFAESNLTRPECSLKL